ncbi:sugar phosphate nucleotidyltransferase [Bradyrhizobium sp.]|uniref:sugar phosphate nucleotidyltransferase n=1 Tax=Bradyrhizobium sp. TaxID=376 RepID=UPI0025BD8ED3|nr:sugar phosphate nucleotidyltransferase [Bradyrhizobium sp.]
MKVVIFCGGKGLRLREFSENTPKPMVPVGSRPIVWHTMKYFAHYGHKEFILALGYKSEFIKDFFLNYSEAMSNDFVITNGGRTVKLLSSDIDDWTITFVDTGIESNIGERLVKVREHVASDEYFMCSYADCLTDAPLDDMIDTLKKSKKTMSFVAVKPSSSFHAVQYDAAGKLVGIKPADQLGLYINGGYWIMRQEVFDYIRPGEEMVEEPMRRLIAANQLAPYRYDGFWACMDTFKEKMMLDDMVNSGKAKWQVWTKPASPPAPPAIAPALNVGAVIRDINSLQ